MAKKTNKPYRKYVRWFWGIYIGIILILIGLFSLISAGRLGVMPTFEELENPELSLASEVISSDGEILGTYYFQENRRRVEYQDISPYLIDALVSVEDERFYRHSGIDFRGLARVLVKSLLLGQDAGGGSTITQQLGKLLFPRETYRTFSFKFAIRKFREWVIAIKLEKTFTKEEIIALYLNKYDFIYNASGVESASYVYFNKPPYRLNIEEAAVLAALAKNPSLYNPMRFEENARNRRDLILNKMKEQGYAESTLVDSVKQLDIQLDYHPVDHKVGPATYFRMHLQKTLTERKPRDAQAVREWENDPLRGWCYKNFKQDGSTYNLYRDGLKIYTTIDSRMQQYAEEAVVEHIRDSLQKQLDREFRWNRNAPFPADYSQAEIERQMALSRGWSERYRVHKHEQGLSEDSIRKLFDTPVRMNIFSWKGSIDTVMTPNDSIRYYRRFLRAAFMAVTPQTGHVKAYVGGTDFRHFQYDQIMQGSRQVGSVFKPFVYTLAMEHGYGPCYRVPNIHYFIEGNFGGVEDTIYQPKFSSTAELDGKMVTLKQGLGKSLNQISVWVIKQFNPASVIEIARKLGVKSPIEPNWSICVGAVELPVYEVVSAFTAFPNKGIWVEPIFVTRIEDKDGNLLATFRPREEVAMEEDVAYKMLNLMEYTTSWEGTGRRLRHTYQFKNPIAAKTGTTNDNADGWFVGIVPNLVGGAWAGGEDRSIRFVNNDLGQGSNMALPIWALFMKKVYADSTLGISQEPFERPLHFDVITNCDSIFPDNRNRDDDFDEYFRP